MTVYPNASASFLSNPRKLQELAMRPAADRLYRSLFPSMINVERYDHEAKNILDREHGIDACILFDNQQIITLQEKFLSHQYSHYQSLTVEYEQNQFTHEMGDWTKLACQLYFVGYATAQGDAFASYVVIDFARLVIETQNGRVAWRQGVNKWSAARASFKFIAFRAIPTCCIVAYQF